MYERAGGYYIGMLFLSPSLLGFETDYLPAKDIGASKLISEGKIKLKNDCAISHFIENGIVFEDGNTLPADVVIFATGCVTPIRLMSVY